MTPPSFKERIMKFLAIEPFFFNGQYYPAASDAPLAFNFPKDEVPNVRWYPMDQEALASLELLQKTILAYGNKCVIHRIPQGVKPPDYIWIEAPAKVDPDALPPGIKLDGRPDSPEQFTMSEIQAANKGMIPRPGRPSDTEPTKR